jgi:hypothetical protein
VYTAQALAQVPRLLSCLDREPHSATGGCFDRDHWSWKFRDFPLGNLHAAAYALALLWKHPFADNPYFGSPRLLEWIEASIDFRLRQQHANGAFDSFTPNEQDGGATLWAVHGILEACRVLGDSLNPELRARVVQMTARAVAFTSAYEENHGFVSNHRALYALALLDAHELLGDDGCLRRAETWIDSIIARQSPDGWYFEYEGPDPGYESLGIFHLALYWRRTHSRRLLESLGNAVEFFSWCVHPDGSAGGSYGSRHTALYFPGGFEILASELPVAGAVARFLRERIASGNVVTPAISDIENLPPLLFSYLEAALAADTTEAVPSLPCEAFTGTREFPASGIAVHATHAYYFIWNAAKGGVCRCFDKTTGTVCYEDAGYLVRAGGRNWTSQIAGMGKGSGWVANAGFAEYRQEQISPFRFLVLRILNLTLFRSPALGDRVRRVIVKRLILTKRPGALALCRRAEFGPDWIRLHDRLSLSGPMSVESVELPRSLLPIHMGSARYFHPSELKPLPPAATGQAAAQLNRGQAAEVTIEICVSQRLRHDLSPAACL